MLFFVALECPAVETKYFFVISILAFKTAPVLRFPACRPPRNATGASFPSMSEKDSSESTLANVRTMDCDESCSEMLGKRSTGGFGGGRKLGNEALVPFSRPKWKKQKIILKIAFEKISSILLVPRA